VGEVSGEAGKRGSREVKNSYPSSDHRLAIPPRFHASPPPRFPASPPIFQHGPIRNPHRQRPAEQPAGHQRRPASSCTHRGHRAVGLGEEHARFRHALRGRPAAVHRVAFHLRQTVSRPHAQASGGPARGTRPSGGDRAAKPGHLQSLDGRYGHRGLRLSPAALGSDRTLLLPQVRRAGPAGHPAGSRGRDTVPDQWAGADLLSPAPGGSSDPCRRGGEFARARLRAGGGRWSSPPSRRASPQARSDPDRRAAHCGRSPDGRARFRRTPVRGRGDGVPGG
jgi:hypothetical protein